ncbi:hypothetical protein [Bacillus siamensis]|uniref:hypothetical protein n=1 Tax=Bacillus siamensis TaxID=659243 RepID=UPI002E1AF9D6|nr:hypothetical protein [Bacillus siamensis]MED0777993.1 hypothetical protein [Bacillus siamensis]MED0832777.1 hypothetical protein [Bacillus siamensis]
MNQLEFWSSVIKSTTWPIVVLIVVWLLRKPITNMIEKIAELKFKYKDLEATFSKGLHKAEAELELQSSVSDNSESSDSQEDEESSLKNSNSAIKTKIAKEAPHLLVVMSWLLVENELNSVIDKLDNPSDLRHKPPTAKMKYLVDNNYLDRSFLDAFVDLGRLRNVAVHNVKEAQNISYLESKKYNNLTKKIIKGLQNIKYD